MSSSRSQDPNKQNIMWYCAVWFFLDTIPAWKKPLTDWDKLILLDTCISPQKYSFSLYPAQRILIKAILSVYLGKLLLLNSISCMISLVKYNQMVKQSQDQKENDKKHNY